MKYYAQEFRPGRWHVCDVETRRPIYDDEPYGNDAPVVFDDEDKAYECVQRLNAKPEDEDEISNI